MKLTRILFLLSICAISANQIIAQTAVANLKLWWKLNEPVGATTITDYAIGTKQLGVSPKDATINSGILDNEKGNVASFKKIANAIVLRNPTLNLVTGAIDRTYSFWAKKEVAQGAVDQVALFGQLGLPGGGGGMLVITPGNGKSLVIMCGGESKNIYTNPSENTNNEGVWHHYVITSTDGTTGGLKCYVDNVEWTASVKNSVALQTTNVIRVGHSYIGSIADFRLYNKALSQDEITAVYNEGLSRK
jgi:hypothetical protein